MEKRPEPSRRIKVLYSPTQANRLMISKLRRLPMLEGIEFSRLPEDVGERREILMCQKDRRNTLLIWGNGEAHDDSYFNTLRTLPGNGKRLKVNLDPHSDEYVSDDDGGDYDFENQCAKRDSISCLNYATHMSFTERSGVEIFTTNTIADTNIFTGLIKEVASIIAERITGRGLRRFVRAAGKFIRKFVGEVDVTLDLDLVRGIPVMEKYLVPNSVGAIPLLRVLKESMGRVHMFDMGGLQSPIPDFILDENINLEMPPSKEKVLRYLELGKTERISSLVMPGNGMNHVGSYTAMFMANVIRIFAESRAEAAPDAAGMPNT